MSFVQDVLIVGTAVVFHSKSCHVEVAKSTRVSLFVRVQQGMPFVAATSDESQECDPVSF